MAVSGVVRERKGRREEEKGRREEEKGRKEEKGRREERRREPIRCSCTLHTLHIILWMKRREGKREKREITRGKSCC